VETPGAPVLDAVARLLRAQSTLSLSTSSPEGRPHIAPVFFLADNDLCLYWFSAPNSRHSRDLARNAAAAVAVFAPTENWREIRGVQMRGRAAVVRDAARRSAIVEHYSIRFALGTEFDALLAKHRLYEFRPVWIRYLDNTVHFGYKAEFRLSGRRNA